MHGLIRRAAAALATLPVRAGRALGQRAPPLRNRRVGGSSRVYVGTVGIILLLVVAMTVLYHRASTQTSQLALHPYAASTDVERVRRLWTQAKNQQQEAEQGAIAAERHLTSVYKEKGASSVVAEQAKYAAAQAEQRAQSAQIRALRMQDEYATISRNFYLHRAIADVRKYVYSARRKVKGYGVSHLSMTSAVSGGDAAVPEFIHCDSTLDIELIKGLQPLDAAATCELMILGVESCDRDLSTYIDCVLMAGYDIWSDVLQPQCSDSPFWKALGEELEAQFPRISKRGLLSATTPASSLSLKRRNRKRQVLDKVVTAAAIEDPAPQATFRERWKRVHPAQYSDPLTCEVRGKTYTIFPLSYGITSNYFSRSVTRRKLLDWYPILPALKPLTSRPLLPPGMKYRMSYSLGEVDEYLNMILLRFSKFAWSHIRGGPDSMRHYEILSQGTLPFFVDLDACEYKPCLSHLPLRELHEATRLGGVSHIPTVADANSSVLNEYFYRISLEEAMARGSVALFTPVVNFIQTGRIDAKAFDESAYRKVAEGALARAREGISCASVVKSLLLRAGIASDRYDGGGGDDKGKIAVPKSILFISFPHTDYITYTLECGMSELGLNYTVNYRFGTAYVDQDEEMMRPIHRSPNASFDVITGRSFIHSVLDRHTTKNYGNGFATAQKVNPPPNRIFPSQSAMCDAVERGDFDFFLIAWKSPSFLRDSCFDVALRVMGPDRVVIVDGEDVGFLPNLTEYAALGVKIFSRESRCVLLE